MFTAAPFTTAKIWKQPKCPLTEEWLKMMWYRTSLVVQWLRICLAVKGTPVQSLVQEDSTCRRATRPVLHHR